MVVACLALIAVAFGVSLPTTALVRRLGLRLRALDSGGVAGQVKMPPRSVPNTGGVAIFASIALPIVVGLVAVRFAPGMVVSWFPSVSPHLAGIAERTPMAILLVGCLLVLHVVGLIDDRRALGPGVKMVFMVGAAAAITVGSGSRLLTLLDAHVGGPWVSYVVTVAWIVVITNAMNFLDNMDGLAGGVGAIAGACFLAATLAHPHPQWFIAACLALLIGGLGGFLVFNAPPAKIFMGDGGSLVLGFLLAFLTVRTTYFDPSDARPEAGAWYGVLMPIVVLAVPLYDFVSVTVLRLMQGKSPFVGDLQHVSHRMVKRGLSRPATVLVIVGLTAVTGMGGIALASLQPWQAALVGVQTVMSLVVLAAFEISSAGAGSGGSSGEHGGKRGATP